MADRPNFLCILTDQQRADHLGCMGNGVLRTPNIDRIGHEGVIFDRAYVNNPLCMPSRATLFTGLTARGHGVRTNGIDLDPRIPTMTQALASAGYRTHGVGKVHLRGAGIPWGANKESLRVEDHPESHWAWKEAGLESLPLPYFGLQTVDFVGGHGQFYGDYLNWLRKEHPDAAAEQSWEPSSEGAVDCARATIPEELHVTTWIADRTIAFLEDQASAERPFFLWCSIPDPHHPYWPPGKYADLYRAEDVAPPLGSPEDLDAMPPHYREAYEAPRARLSGLRDPAKDFMPGIRSIIAHTYGAIALIDRNVGRILDALDRLGLSENTAVTFFSDHGDLMGDHGLVRKGPFAYEGLVRVPMLWRWPGVFQPPRTQALASLLDFAPTVLDLAEVPIPEGRTPPEPECPMQRPPWPGRSLAPLLRGKVERVQDAAIVENDEDYLGLRMRTLVTERYKLTVYAGEDYGELLDLENDPGERRNLWYDPDHQDLRKDLSVRLLHELARTDSTLPRRMGHA